MGRKRRTRMFALLLAFAMSLAAPLTVSAAEGEAATMKLTKTEGTVEIFSSTGKPISLIDNMRLYNGYQIDTDEKSYAWISLDGTKLVKVDAVSEVSIRKRGKKLEILVESGNIFFNVSKPLEEEESMNIRTSTMVAGIRGTCGWLETRGDKNTRLSLLEGKVEAKVSDPVTGETRTDSVSGGEAVNCLVYEEDRGVIGVISSGRRMPWRRSRASC